MVTYPVLVSGFILHEGMLVVDMHAQLHMPIPLCDSLEGLHEGLGAPALWSLSVCADMRVL